MEKQELKYLFRNHINLHSLSQLMTKMLKATLLL